MAFQLQTAELANRLRRSFGLRGAVDVPLDSSAVQTVRVFDSSGAPFRTSGLSWYAQLALGPGGAGTFNEVIFGASAQNVIPLVDQMEVYSATAQVIRLTTRIQTAFPAPTVFSPEQVPAAGTATANGPMAMTGNAPGAAIAGGFKHLLLVAGETLVVPMLGYLVQPGIEIVIGCNAANTDLTVSLSGRWYELSPGS